MRCIRVTIGLALLACDPAPIDLGPEVAGDESTGDPELPTPAEPGMLVDVDRVDGRAGLKLSIAPDGSMYVGGSVDGLADEQEAPLWLARFDREGALLWEETLDVVAGGIDVSATTNGVYVSVLGLEEAWIERRRADGEVVWSTTELGHATATPDGGFVTTDRSDDGTWLRKLDADRIEQWATFFAGELDASTAFLHSIDVAQDGRILVLGTDLADLPLQSWIVLLDQDGVVQWKQTFAAVPEDRARVDATNAGAVVLRPAPVGEAWGFADDGTQQWAYTDDRVDAPNTFAAVPSGGFVVARMVTLPDGDPTCQHAWTGCSTHIEVRRVDDDQAVVWDAATEACNWTMDAEIAPNGDFVLLGTCVENDTGVVSMALLRYGV